MYINVFYSGLQDSNGINYIMLNKIDCVNSFIYIHISLGHVV